MADTVYGLTSTGFNTKRLRDIQDSIKNRLLLLKDPDTGESLQVDFDEDDPIIQIVNAFCDELSGMWQMAAENYSQFNPLLASGSSLSGLVQLNGILRKTGTPSSVVLTFVGELGVLVPLGTKVADEDGNVVWLTSVDAVIGTGGNVSVTAYSQDNGAFSYIAGTINTIVEAISGITSVVNQTDSTPGTPDETDQMLRLRRSKSTETPSIGIAESIYGGLNKLDGVTYAKVFCNRTNATDAKGIPAHSIAVIVRGGDNTEIAKEIFIRAGVATGFHGSTTINIIDSMQVATPVSFTRPDEVEVDVSIVVDEIEGSEFPADFAALIKQNIVDYAVDGPAGIGIEGGSFDSFGFPPSENIVASRLYIPVNAVKGIKICSLEIAKHGETLGTDDIVIDWDEVGLFVAENITVTKLGT